MSNRELINRVENLVGARIASCRPVEGGYTPATRLVCETSGGSFFVKAGSTPLTCEFLRREIEVYRSLTGEFMPKLIAWEDHELEPVLVLEDLSRGYWPPPWTDELIEATLKQIEAMHRVKSTLKPFCEVRGARQE